MTHLLLRLGAVGLWLAAGVHAGAVLAAQTDCLQLLPAQVVSTQTLPGKHSRTTAVLSTAAGKQPSLSRLQARLHALGGNDHVMRQRTDGWQVFSYWQGNALCIVQVRTAGERIRAGYISRLRFNPGDSGAAHAGASGRSGLPRWWPGLQRQRIEHWRDAGVNVSTIIGYAGAATQRVQQRFTRRALAAGYRLVGSWKSRQSPAPAGSMLLFAQSQRELLLVFTPQGARTGVVAHLKEFSQ